MLPRTVVHLSENAGVFLSEKFVLSMFSDGKK